MSFLQESRVVWLTFRTNVRAALGVALTWHNPENKHMCRISTRKDINFLDEKNWPECFEWLKHVCVS